MIIHISGAPGSGKTTLGKQLQSYYVKDLDDLFREFTESVKKFDPKKFDPKKYQKFIYEFIESKKDIIFVGLNSEHITKHYYDIAHGRELHKFYIDLPVEENLRRHFLREIDGWLNWMKGRDKKILFDQLVEDEKAVVADLKRSIARPLKISEQRKFIESFAPHYKKDGYQFLSAKQISSRVRKLMSL